MWGARLACVLACAYVGVAGSTTYQFNFTAVRAVQFDGVALAEVALYSLNGSAIPISGASNPGGTLAVWWEHAGLAIDGNLATKWHDHTCVATPCFHSTFASSSVLLLQVPDGIVVANYNLWTANGPERRDPVSWSLGIRWPNGTVMELSQVDGVSPPSARQQPFSPTPFPAISSPPSPLAPPSPRPPPPDGDVYLLAIDAVRAQPFVNGQPHIDGVQVSPCPCATPMPGRARPWGTYTCACTAHLSLHAPAHSSLASDRAASFDLRAQLGEVELYGPDGDAVPFIDAGNPGGDGFGYSWHAPINSIDGNPITKWFDSAFTADSQLSSLVLQVARGTTITGYNLWTANSPPQRDPISWMFGRWCASAD